MDMFLIVLMVSAIFGSISAAIGYYRRVDLAMAFLAGGLLGPLGIMTAFLMTPLGGTEPNNGVKRQKGQPDA